MNPAVYYRMEEWPKSDKKGSYVLVDSAPGGHHGDTAPGRRVRSAAASGQVRRCARSSRPMVGDYAIVPDYPKTDNGQLSVSAWVWAVTFGSSALVDYLQPMRLVISKP